MKMNWQIEHTCCGFTEPRRDTMLPSISSFLGVMCMDVYLPVVVLRGYGAVLLVVAVVMVVAGWWCEHCDGGMWYEVF